MITTTKEKSTRRTIGASNAAAKGDGQRSARAREAGAAIQNQTGRLGEGEKGRRFRMIGHTVCIHNPRAEWSELKGSYGTVTNQWGDGGVCVEVTRWGASKTRIQFSRQEIEHVPLNDAIRHDASEECALVRRAIDLEGIGLYPYEHGLISDHVTAVLKRRAEKLKVQIRGIQRLRQHSLAKQARYAEIGLGNYCTAIVPYAGGVL